MIEQVVGVLGAIAVCAGVFLALVALGVWFIEAPDRKEDRERRKRWRDE